MWGIPRASWESGWRGCVSWETNGSTPSSSSNTRRKASVRSSQLSSGSLILPLGRLVLRISPSQQRNEKRAQKDDAQGESHAVPEVLRDIVNHDDGHDDIHTGDQGEQDPPDWFLRDLQPYDGVVDRNNRRPTGLARLLEYRPYRGGFEHEGDDRDNPEQQARRIRRCRERVLQDGEHGLALPRDFPSLGGFLLRRRSAEALLQRLHQIEHLCLRRLFRLLGYLLALDLAVDVRLHPVAHVVLVLLRLEFVGRRLLDQLHCEIELGLLDLGLGDRHLGDVADLIGVAQLLHYKPALHGADHDEVLLAARGVLTDRHT